MSAGVLLSVWVNHPIKVWRGVFAWFPRPSLSQRCSADVMHQRLLHKLLKHESLHVAEDGVSFQILLITDKG